MIISGDYKDHFQRRVDTFKKLYSANAVLMLIIILTEYYRLSFIPYVMLVLVFKTVVMIGIMGYIFSKNSSIGFQVIGILYSAIAGMQADLFTDENTPFNFDLFTLQTGLLVISTLAFTGLSSLYGILGSIWVLVCYFITFISKVSFNYTYFYLAPFVFFGIILNGIIQDHYESEKEMVRLINYYKEYSIQLITNHLPKRFHVMNVTSLYVDISAIFSYYYKEQSLGLVKKILKDLYKEFEMDRKHFNIDTSDEDRGFYSFLVYENPAGTDMGYADALAEFAIRIRNSFEHLCKERNINFRLRMGMDSGKLVDYIYEDKNSLLTVFKSLKVMEKAREMEHEGMNGQIQVTSDSYALLKKNFVLVKRDISITEQDKSVYILKEKRGS
ncbi:MAG: adenylate/guanylate cyclase domain-containing protein [Leptospiraceae bacterium]|nr:adenylate/guanylate cyclase domain-containing protein [Leptospiraceae bacterium]